MRRIWNLRKRFGIAAPRVAVRTQVAWYWRWLGLTIVAAAAMMLALWMYDTGRRFAGFDRRVVEGQMTEIQGELDTARGDLKRLRGELDKLRAEANAAESRLAIERTALQKLAEQIRVLERDNARLREELATFESMLSSDTRQSQPLAVHRFKVEPDVLPGEYRYRLLLLTSGTRKDKDFEGRIELVVSLNEGGKNAMMVFPESKDASASAFRLSFKYFQRVEGIFRVSPKARLQSVQVRVYEGNDAQPRVTRAVQLG